jgi:hypothetical protein
MQEQSNQHHHDGQFDTAVAPSPIFQPPALEQVTSALAPTPRLHHPRSSVQSRLYYFSSFASHTPASRCEILLSAPSLKSSSSAGSLTLPTTHHSRYLHTHSCPPSSNSCCIAVLQVPRSCNPFIESAAVSLMSLAGPLLPSPRPLPVRACRFRPRPRPPLLQQVTAHASCAIRKLYPASHCLLRATGERWGSLHAPPPLPSCSSLHTLHSSGPSPPPSSSLPAALSSLHWCTLSATGTACQMLLQLWHGPPGPSAPFCWRRMPSDLRRSCCYSATS